MKRKKGLTLTSTLLGVVIFVMSAFTLLKFLSTDTRVTAEVQNQRDVLALNDVVNDIYTRYKAGDELTVSVTGDDPKTSSILISFTSEDGAIHSVNYDGSSSWVTNDGLRVFKADSFTFEDSGSSLFISISVDQAHKYELTMYR